MTHSDTHDIRTVGISSIGYYIPPGILSSEEMAEASGIPLFVFTEKIGIERKHIAGIDEHPADMGVKAAEAAMKTAGISPEEIGIVAYCGAGFYEYQFWSPSAKIQAAIGAPDAYAFEIRNGCNGGNLGLTICKSLLLGDPEKSHALVVCSDKFSIAVDYSNTQSLSIFNAGDGAAAAVLAKDEPTNQLLSYASVSDGSLADHVKLPFGGTKIPLTREDTETRLRHLCVEDPEELDRIFSQVYLRNYVRVIREALEKSGYSLRDIDHLFTNQVKRSLSKSIFEALAVPEDRTVLTMREYGHMGPVDTLFGLACAHESGRIRSGDLVVLASSGLGFTWGATAIQY